MKHRIRPLLSIDLNQSCAALLVLFSVRDRGVHVSQNNSLCKIVLSSTLMVNLSLPNVVATQHTP
ncbi:MAG: hypothetical protein ACRC8Y_05740 [Chroococcales cyanobacterium]